MCGRESASDLRLALLCSDRHQSDFPTARGACRDPSPVAGRRIPLASTSASVSTKAPFVYWHRARTGTGECIDLPAGFSSQSRTMPEHSHPIRTFIAQAPLPAGRTAAWPYRWLVHLPRPVRCESLMQSGQTPISASSVEPKFPSSRNAQSFSDASAKDVMGYFWPPNSTCKREDSCIELLIVLTLLQSHKSTTIGLAKLPVRDSLL